MHSCSENTGILSDEGHGRTRRCAFVFLVLGLAIVESRKNETEKNNTPTFSYGHMLVEVSKTSGTRNKNISSSIHGLTLVEIGGMDKPEQKNTFINSYGNNSRISKNEKETRVVLVAETTEFKNENIDNKKKFKNNTSKELRNNSINLSKMKKRSIESDAGNPRIVSLDYDLIDEVWTQEFVDEYKKNKQGMSGCQIPVLSVLCYLTCLF